jgi:hypothetical protein
VPYVAINFTVWENLKKKYASLFNMGNSPGPFVSAICGGISGAFASTSGLNL